jgi:hypothetical protein
MRLALSWRFGSMSRISHACTRTRTCTYVLYTFTHALCGALASARLRRSFSGHAFASFPLRIRQLGVSVSVFLVVAQKLSLLSSVKYATRDAPIMEHTACADYVSASTLPCYTPHSQPGALRHTTVLSNIMSL